MFDNPFRFHGHDERAPPTPEGPTCEVRCTPVDHPSHFCGHNERTPPSGYDRRAPPTFRATRLSGPRYNRKPPNGRP